MAKPIDNPCTSVCQLSGDICVGCGRTRAQIRGWKKIKRPEKQAAAKDASARLKKIRKSVS
ncbi:MAG: DUF1289 domain-containing protein [Pseudomonadota bacterium]